MFFIPSHHPFCFKYSPPILKEHIMRRHRSIQGSVKLNRLYVNQMNKMQC
ncbi:hypothetical protein HMPREF1551_01113 [Capnocytophaga sp. oral taxon 863 str. F0517]|nr:hypothetical protein HMPREF1551_01113 [Capnocytophaga sp. oral taxon 863 str. F0517]